MSCHSMVSACETWLGKAGRAERGKNERQMSDFAECDVSDTESCLGASHRWTLASQPFSKTAGGPNIR